MLRPLTGPVSSCPRRGLHNVKAQGFSRGWRNPCDRALEGRNSMPHSLADLLVHVVFSTKGRVPLLDSELKPKPYAYMVGIAKQHGCKVHIVNGTNDHVHMLLAAPTTPVWPT